MKKWVSLFFLLTSCQVYNSTSNDSLTSTAASPTVLPNNPESARFVAAFTVLSNNCINCHIYQHSFSSFNTESQFKNAGLVVAENVASSCLYLKLKGSAFAI